MSDLYSILGVDKSADQDEIKRAYRRLAAQHHPDRGGDTKRFQEIQSAYDTLSDPNKRAEYDNPRPQMGGFHFEAHGFPPGFEEMFSQFGDPFSGFFRQRQTPRNRTLNLQASITLEDAFTGKDLLANINLPTGKTITVELKIPAGIQDGMNLRFSGIGDDTIPNAPKGDVHLSVHVQPHHLFQRQGDDLIQQLNLNCFDAILGKTLNVRTIDGKNLEIKVAPGTQHGQILSINGYGMPHVNENRMRGRFLISINITIPTNLTDPQKELVRILNK